MPYVTVKMLEGRTDEQKRNLVEKVTEAVKETTGASEEKIVVFIEEMRKEPLCRRRQTPERYGIISIKPALRAPAFIIPIEPASQ